MNKDLTPRFIVIALVLLWGIWSVWPTLKFQNLTDEERSSLSESGKLFELESKAIKQGLDLKGGMYIVLEVDIPTLIENIATNTDARFENSMIEVRNNLKENPESDFFNLFSDISTKNELRLTRYFFDYGSNNQIIADALKTESEDAIDRVLEILQNRIDQFGVSEPTIQKQGSQRIIVELAGVQDSERARALLESTALLEFYIVKDVTSTNEIMLKIDDALKDNKELISELNTSENEISSMSDETATGDETVSVGDLFGQPKIENDESADSLSEPASPNQI